MRCPNCGTVNPPDGKFCRECGTALRGSTAQEQNGQPLEALSFEEKVDQVQELLAGLDCSRCGYASCRENAEAIVQGESPSDSCVEASPEARERIRQIVGLPERVPWTVSLWRTLTSVKLAIGLIIVLALFSILGTLVPQGQPDLRYLNQYGPTGYKLIKFFSVDRLFHTWYYLGLLVLLGLSTLACLTKRFRLSLRLLCRPRRQSPAQILKLENSAELAISGRPTAALERVTDVLRKQGYRVTRTGNQLYAHKNLVGRLGVDLFHASLLLLLLGALAGGLFGFEGFIQGHKGEVLDVPNADFQIRVDDLWVEHYEGSTQVKDWYTTLTVIDDGQEVKTQTIEVNHPLTYQGVSFYQASFGTDWLRNPMLTFQVLKVEPTADAENATGKGPESLTTPLGEYEITLEESFPVDPEQDITAKLLAFYPDFAMTDQGPINRSLRLNNPAAFLEIYRGDQLKFRGWTFAHFPEMQIWVAMETESNNPDAQPPAGHGSMGGLPYRIDLVGMRAEQFTGLQVSYNPAIWVIYLSFVLMGLGMFLNFYLPPRWAWASAGQGRLVLAVIGRDDREVTGEFEALVEQLRGALPTAGEPSSAEASESHPSSTR